MIKSMTGFAHREIAQQGFRGSLELKSYNNRYLDLSASLPPYLSRLEPRLRAFLSERIVHGKVECSLRVREFDAPVTANADIAAARAVAAVLGQIAQACGIKGPLSLDSVTGFDGVVSFERELDEEALWSRVFPELEACFEEYEASRLREGASTRADIEAQLTRLTSALARSGTRFPK